MFRRLNNAYNRLVNLFNACAIILFGMCVTAIVMLITAILVLQITFACSGPTLIDQWQRCAVKANAVPLEIQVNYIPPQR
jgi:hypothetical protein